MTPTLLVWEDVPCAAQAHTALSSLWEARKTWQNIKKPLEIRGRSAHHGLISSPCRTSLGEKKQRRHFSFPESLFSLGLGVSFVLGGDEKGQRQWGWEPGRNPPSILRSSCGRGKPTAALGLDGKEKPFFMCWWGHPGLYVTWEPPMVAGQENKLGEKILAFKDVTKKLTACFDVISSTSSNSAPENRWLASC